MYSSQLLKQSPSPSPKFYTPAIQKYIRIASAQEVSRGRHSMAAICGPKRAERGTCRKRAGESSSTMEGNQAWLLLAAHSLSWERKVHALNLGSAPSHSTWRLPLVCFRPSNRNHVPQAVHAEPKQHHQPVHLTGTSRILLPITGGYCWVPPFWNCKKMLKASKALFCSKPLLWKWKRQSSKRKNRKIKMQPGEL